MKTAITSKGNKLSSSFDLRFGRAGWFCVYNDATNSVDFIQNEQINANGGAGSKSSEKMAELGINRVISGDFGPKAKDLLERLKIQMVILDESGLTIQKIIDKMKEKQHFANTEI